MSQRLLKQLGLPEIPHVIYEHPPLVLAISQVRFTSVLRASNPEFVARFQEAIEDQYPLASPGEQLEIELALAQNDMGVRRQARSSQWRFADPANNWTVVLAQDFISLETRAYEDFEDFLGRLRHIIAELIHTIKPKLLTRIGLRYINEVRPGHKSWSSVIGPELLGPLTVPALAEPMQLATQQLLLRYSDEQGININHGAIPDGSTIVPLHGEQPPQGPFYLLDFDVFREFSASRLHPVLTDTVVNHVSEYNKVIYRLFRWSVTEEYIQTLEVRR